eukprot:CAMPEP_0114145482 /NCGR_PEP_ID=MMETSP0043_2-20121206/20071_1 /TAXON_ID=464988 /ORGANISM="Hemiselmis andersenii, Strain CCMP644" /LENGTH=102 /DNA_ID=CAMNT_0001239905 /DNA_START=235 /DNA_END=539 /DNA_ORIENTATION=+
MTTRATPGMQAEGVPVNAQALLAAAAATENQATGALLSKFTPPSLPANPALMGVPPGAQAGMLAGWPAGEAGEWMKAHAEAQASAQSGGASHRMDGGQMLSA